MALNVGDRVKASNKAGVIVGVSTYGQLWPENVAAAAGSRRQRHTKIKPEQPVYAVTLDGEDRPRNFFPNDIEKE